MNRGARSLRVLAGLVALGAWVCAAAQTPNPLHFLHFGGHDAQAATDGGHADAAQADGGHLEADAPSAYVIGPADELSVNVWKETEISQTLPVRPDGRISLPLAGTIQASGHTPTQLEELIAAKLAPFISHPVVTVIVVKIGSRSYSVLGNVQKPGTFPLLSPTRVLAALAAAGGFTAFANPGKIEVLHVRADGSVVRYAFNYSAVIQGQDLQQDRVLQPGDTLIVP